MDTFLNVVRRETVFGLWRGLSPVSLGPIWYFYFEVHVFLLINSIHACIIIVPLVYKNSSPSLFVIKW